MIKQKFRLRDFVQDKRSGIKGEISEVIHRTSTTTKSRVESWEYRLSNACAIVPQECIRSYMPCPNCNIVGWDWAVGCVECGLMPGDAND